MDKDIERLHRSEIGAAKTEIRNLPVRLSNPALLDGFISSESCCTALVLVALRENVLLPRLGRWQYVLTVSIPNLSGGLGSFLTKLSARFE